MDYYLPATLRHDSCRIETHSLEEVLKEAHVVSLHTPLNDETHHLIDEPQLKMMKKTAFLVNTSTGDVVKSKALMKALREGWIAGAGIDVVEGREPPEPESEWYPQSLADPAHGLVQRRVSLEPAGEYAR
jgi:phosphoglycerate dehydrogenase-like enzyme